MTYYLIDYENVNTRGLDGVTRLSPEDVVVIFYSENADTMTFGLHRRLNESRASIQYQRVEVGAKNALDFQLCSYLGYLIRENEGKDACFRIVSRDQGYAILATYWKRQRKEVMVVSDITVSRQAEGGGAPKQEARYLLPQGEDVKPDPQRSDAPISPAAESEQEQGAPEPPPVSAPETPEDGSGQAGPADELEAKLCTLLRDSEAAPVVARMIRHYKTKQGINNALMKQFPSQHNKLAAEIYSAIKPLIADKKGR